MFNFLMDIYGCAVLTIMVMILGVGIYKDIKQEEKRRTTAIASFLLLFNIAYVVISIAL